VEIQPLAYMLEDLLQEAGEEGTEVCLAESPRDVGDELTAVREEYTQRFQRAVAAIRELRGAPLFEGRLSDPGYPLGFCCEPLACWSSSVGVIYVGVAHANDTLLLLGGARPHAVDQGGITLLPPPA
jgi:hypothetical protein